MSQVITKAEKAEVIAAIRDGKSNQTIRRQLGWHWTDVNRLREALRPKFVPLPGTQRYLGAAISPTYQPQLDDGRGVVTEMALVIHAGSRGEALARQICWHIAARKLSELSRATGHDHCYAATDARYDGCCDGHEDLAAQKRSLRRFADVTCLGLVELPAEEVA